MSPGLYSFHLLRPTGPRRHAWLKGKPGGEAGASTLCTVITMSFDYLQENCTEEQETNIAKHTQYMYTRPYIIINYLSLLFAVYYYVVQIIISPPPRKWSLSFQVHYYIILENELRLQ